MRHMRKFRVFLDLLSLIESATLPELGSYNSRRVEYPDGPRETCDGTNVEAEGEVDGHWLSGFKT
jgi:hypothetical protein